MPDVPINVEEAPGSHYEEAMNVSLRLRACSRQELAAWCREQAAARSSTTCSWLKPSLTDVGHWKLPFLRSLVHGARVRRRL